jgi:ATP-dependent DNA ligase
VVGGFRYASKGGAIGSLLLGLYDRKGLLHHVGYTSSRTEADRRELVPKLKKLIHPPGFTGNAPGGPSRWSTKRSTEWQPLRPLLVVEVEYDHVSGYRFRHRTRFLRFRLDKPPRKCELQQLRQPEGKVLTLLGPTKARPAAARRSAIEAARRPLPRQVE